jgi:adenine-specific DNA glycosylase
LPDPPSLPTAYSFVIELSFATSEDKARLKQGLGRLTETFVNQDSSAQIMRLDDYGNPVCIPKDPACASCVFCSDPMDYECQDQASQCGPLLTAVDALVDDKVVRFVYKDMPPRALAPPLEQYVLCANHYPAPGSTYVNECHTATYQDGGL